ncbi:type II toxin-antitoxin system RelE/ParE family toxin [Teichococcus coralli]|nr:type II toxin-antitoxin system RelE/ParE family toxin [Pseudoroseomonas coralli]
MAKLVWLPEAVADLDRLLDDLRARSPEAARRAAQAVIRVTRRLAEEAMLGRPMGDGTGRRELLVPLAGIGLVLRYALDEAGRVALIRIGGGGEQRA